MLPVAILAGGLATRLRPLTEKIPKSLIEVAGQPFVFHQLNLLQKKGIEDVVFCTGFLGEMLEAAVGNGDRWGMRIQYSPDGPLLRGTGGALKRAAHLLGEKFFIVYGDSYLDCNFGEVAATFEALGRQALMTVYRNENQWDRSNVEFRDGKLVTYDKRNITPDMHHIDWGLGVLRASLLDGYPSDVPFDLASVYQDALQAGELAGFEVPNRFYEIGSTSGIEETAQFLSRHRENG